MRTQPWSSIGVRRGLRRRSRGSRRDRSAVPARFADKRESEGGQRAGLRADIQGLRAVAVLLVVVDHTGASFLTGGYIGVDVFFVLSGFLITQLLFKGAAQRGRISLVDFYVRRARRILPAAALTLLATDVAAYKLLNFVRAKAVLHDSIASALFAENIRLTREGTNYFAQAGSQLPSPLQHFWSLAVEEQFYVVWPAVFGLTILGISVAIRRHRQARRRPHPRRGPFTIRWRTYDATGRGPQRVLAIALLIGAASLAWSVHDTHTDATVAYFSSLSRAWELALGAVLAVAAAHMARMPTGCRLVAGWLGLAAIIAAAVLFSSSTPFPGYAALLPTAGAALVIVAGIASGTPRLGVGRVLSVPPLRYIGDRSYAFYLWHFPVLIIAAQRVGHELSVTTNLLLVAGAFVLALLSYRFWENPLRRHTWKPPAGALVLWPASVLSVVLLAGVFLYSISNRTIALATEAAEVAARPQQAAGASSRGAVVATIGGEAIPAVRKAANLAARGAPLPASLTPPVSDLVNAHYTFPTGCAPGDTATSAHVCRLGHVASRFSVVLLGDSHAQMWMPDLLSLALRKSWTVIPLVHSGCVPASWVGDGPSYCAKWFDWAVRQAELIHPNVIVTTGAYSGLGPGAGAKSVDAFTSLLVKMRHHAHKMMVIDDPPGETKQPVDCLLGAGATMATCSSTPSSAQQARSGDMSAQAQTFGAAFLPTSGWFCYDNECPTVVGNTVVYSDRGHVTNTYAAYLAAPFAAEFARAVSTRS